MTSVLPVRRQATLPQQCVRDLDGFGDLRLASLIAMLGSPRGDVRLSGVLGVLRLADTEPTLRRLAAADLTAWLRDDATADRARDVAVRGLRERLLDPEDPASWCDLEIDLRGATLRALDLSGVQIRGGALRLDRARIDGPLDLSGLVLDGGLVSLDRARISGEVRLTGAQVLAGQLSFEQVDLAGGILRLDGARVAGGLVTFRDAQLTSGTVSARGMEVSGGQVTFNGAAVGRARVMLDDIRVSGGAVYLSAMTVTNGLLRVARPEVTGGVLSAALTRAVKGRVVLDPAVRTGVDDEPLAPRPAADTRPSAETGRAGRRGPAPRHDRDQRSMPSKNRGRIREPMQGSH